ncbi:MAG: hypothetical protein V4455_09170, partial [Pseudomonadota bacterium]
MSEKSILRTTPSGLRVNGLTIFAAVLLVLLLVLLVGGNLAFNRMSRQPEKFARSPSASAPANVAPTTGTAAPAAPDSAQAQKVAAPAATVTTIAFAPPPEDAMPEGQYGDVVRRGEQIFMETSKYAGRFVGNNL